MTSSPRPTPSASSERTSASVPFATPIVSGTPRYAAASSSKARTFGPSTKCADSRTPSIASRILGSRGAYWAFRSTSGKLSRGTASESRRWAYRSGFAAGGSRPRQTVPAAAPYEQRRDGEQDQGRHEVVDVAEGVVEPLPVRAERPPDRREAEAPRRRAGDREQEVADERHTPDARGHGDERAHHGSDAPQEDERVAVAVEPAVGAAQLLRIEVQPAAVALGERPSAVAPDCPAADRADHVARRSRRRDRNVRRESRRDLPAEEHDAARERPRSERAAVDHHELARRRQYGVHEHQQEDGVEAVIPNRVGDGLGDPGEGGGERHLSEPSRVGRRFPLAEREALRELGAAELVDRSDAEDVAAAMRRSTARSAVPDDCAPTRVQSPRSSDGHDGARARLDEPGDLRCVRERERRSHAATSSRPHGQRAERAVQREVALCGRRLAAGLGGRDAELPGALGLDRSARSAAAPGEAMRAGLTRPRLERSRHTAWADKLGGHRRGAGELVGE